MPSLSSFRPIIFLALAIPGFAQSRVVISQIYGGGGNSGATYTNDFIELLNTGDTAQDLSGWSVQYASSTGTTWQVTPLSGSILPGRYYLVKEAVGAGGTAALPNPEVTGTIALSATAGKIALVSSATALSGSCPTGVIDLAGFGAANCFEGTAPTPAPSNTLAALRAGNGCSDGNTNDADFSTGTPNPRNGSSPVAVCLSIGNVSQNEGNAGITNFVFSAKVNVPAPASGVSFTASTADGTAAAGSDYTALVNVPFAITAGQTSVDVTVAVTGDSIVENDETFTVALADLSGASPAIPALTATGTILNDDASSAGLSFSLTALAGGPEGSAYSQNLTVSNGAACSFSASGSVPPGLSLSFTGADNRVSVNGTPSLSGSFDFTLSANCANGSVAQAYRVAIAFACETGVKTSTAIHTIQGAGAASPIAGQVVEAEGVVTASFQGAGQFRGFYLQEPDATWDSNPATSEAVFIFDNGAGPAVKAGDRVRVRGTVSEFASSGSSLTEIGSLTSEQVCSTGNLFTRTQLTLPVSDLRNFESLEGMAVQLNQQLTVTGNFNLGGFGQIDLAPRVLFTPTQSADRASWPTTTDLNARSILALDDGSSLANASLYPTLFPQGGLSASNTLRTGALVNYDGATQTNSPLIGILDDRYGSYRVQPTAPVTFFDANPRPTIAHILPAIAGRYQVRRLSGAQPAAAAVASDGRYRAVSANVLNFFVTLNKRGAATALEFDHQKTKVIEELSAMNADLYGLSEVQNYANGNASGDTYTNAALQSLVDGLNCKANGGVATCANPPATPYSFIDTLSLGSGNGTDAIRNVMIYRPSVLTPVGSPALYYQNDTNRPSLAQTFRPATGAKAEQQTFTFVVNHFRSKGSACGGTSDDVYQGSCNGLRLNMAMNVASWLATNPTADPAAARKLLLVGDFNAYFGEDPIQFLTGNGYTDLVDSVLGAGAYSYNFGSQSGYLDHALANPAFNNLVSHLAEWHINADEPAALEALDTASKSPAAQVAYYGADPYAASDHDPIVIGFNTLPGDLNDDGVIDALDQQIMTRSLGKSAAAADRRVDYDGDGRITNNDYKIWYGFYRAFIQ